MAVKSALYTVVDVETTGNGIYGNKITEVALFKTDGQEILDEFSSLVNPKCEIPYFITGLTGIDNAMVRDAPTFGELASGLYSFLAGSIFVAHSVNFDYNVIKHEFANVQQEFRQKKLCTVRLSRKLFPGYQSYSLGKLCTARNIPLHNRHRARGDAHATTLLFHQLYAHQNAPEVFTHFLNARSQEATLPAALPTSDYKKLPGQPGIYFFKDQQGTILYVGKAKNIKKRVLSHFYDKATREVQLCGETAHIDFELAGSELIALLMESAAIQQYFPKYNRAQKKRAKAYGIFSYQDRNGIMHLGYNLKKHLPNALETLYSTSDCRLYLEQLCERFSLCPKFCHLQDSNGPCNHYKLSCSGICTNKEDLTAYNEKVAQAIAHICNARAHLIIKEKGRTSEEEGFVVVSNNAYVGYGFVEKSVSISHMEGLDAFMIPQKNSQEALQIITSYCTKKPENVIPLKQAIG